MKFSVIRTQNRGEGEVYTSCVYICIFIYFNLIALYGFCFLWCGGVVKLCANNQLLELSFNFCILEDWNQYSLENIGK